jgi:hypothetical protein
MNAFIVTGPCPIGFTGIGKCLRYIPETSQFKGVGDATSARYIYKPDPSKSVQARFLDAPKYLFNKVPKTVQTLESVKTNAFIGLPVYNAYKAEMDRIDNEMKLIIANVEKEKKVEAAFKDLQTAENARDKAPVAYQQARTTYYTLLRGDKWKAEEKERLARAEVDPEIQRMRANLTDAQYRVAQQQRTVDVINGLKNNVLSLKDDFKYSADTLQRQLDKIKQQIQFDARKRQEASSESKWELLDRVLNYAIVGVLAFAAFMIYKMIRSPSPAPAPSAPVTSGGGVREFLNKYVPLPA